MFQDQLMTNIGKCRQTTYIQLIHNTDNIDLKQFQKQNSNHLFFGLWHSLSLSTTQQINFNDGTVRGINVVNLILLL